jgi:isopentenyl diphosphate isomerase/L-lactate dehydrogenase-like FMN-dependent dehydrogenase
MEPVNLLEYEPLARAKLPVGNYDFIAGGAEDEVTLRENRAAFGRILLRPRAVVDVSHIDTSTEVMGRRVAVPFGVAPMGGQRMAHLDGEPATARAAAAAGALFVLSTTANYTMEEVAAASDGPRWFQLYYYGREIAERMVREAEATGYGAICLTVDSAWYGRRERDLRRGFQWPAEAAPTRLRGELDEQAFLRQRAVTWDEVAWLRSITALPVVIKGLVRGDDARLAVEHGAAGVVVSNHGGRQLDGALAAVEALPEVVEAVAGGAEVYMDGGVRRGTDVLKALALGARAVFVGRPVLWGLAVDGEAGARRVLELLRFELETAMALCGCREVSEIDGSLVRRAPAT